MNQDFVPINPKEILERIALKFNGSKEEAWNWLEGRAKDKNPSHIKIKYPEEIYE